MHRLPWTSPCAATAAFGTLLLAVAAGTASAQILAGPGVIQSEGGPEAILVADFDDDQILDLIVTAPLTSRVNIHTGRGNGSFRFPLSIPVGSGLVRLAMADLDGNGAEDLVGIDPVGGDLVLLHQFPGTSTPYRLTRLPGEDEPSSLLLQDLEDDLDVDVLVSYTGADEIGIYRNHGGTLTALEHRSVGDGPGVLRLLPGPNPAYALAQRGVLSRNLVLYNLDWSLRQLIAVHPVADLAPIAWNGDAWPDFLAVDQDGLLSVHLGSAGNWGSGPSWPISSGATAVEPFFAQDARPGAAVLEAQHNRLALHLDGGAVGVPDPAWFLGGGVTQMIHTDIEPDGNQEFLVPLPQDNLVLVLRRIGDELRGYRSFRSGELPSRLRSHDAVGGLPARLFTLCQLSDDLWIHDRLAGELIPRSPLPTQADARDLRLGQIDGDGLPDIAVLSRTLGVQIFRSSGSDFAAPLQLVLSGDLRDLELLHLDDDQQLDLAVADHDVPGIRLFHGDGNGGYSAGDTLIAVDPTVVLRTRDFDLDGRDDLFAVGEDRRPSLFYRNADGSWQRNSWLLGHELRGIAIGRFNEDQYPDVAIGNAEDNTFSVLSTLLPRFMTISEENRAAPDGSEVMAALDIDADGLDDLAISSSTTRSVSLHIATGAGKFAPPSRIRCSTQPLDLLAFDANGDGTRDVMVTDGGGSSIVMLEVLDADPAPGDSEPPTQSPYASAFAELTVAPNPSSGLMQMRVFSSAREPQFRVFDLRGRLVTRLRAEREGGGWFRAQWAGEEVAAGRYYLQVRAGEQQETRALLRLPR